MLLRVSQRLSDDHRAVNEVLQQLLTALHNKDLETTYSKLDLLWARLAVHIRAEHLHLFPAILARSAETQPTIDRLHVDHDFFMRELAQAIRVLREARTTDELVSIDNTVREIERRLVEHNEIEETRVYNLAGTILNDSEQTELAAHINAELENRPPRFSLESWQD